MASPVESENQTSPFDDGQSSNDAYGPPKCRPVGSRRFLSACMEEIEPIVQQRGKDTMYQCCYCGKWCTMSGTRALSKHIENDHRPQVIPVIRNGNGCLAQSLGLGETKYLYVTFTPLESWNVQIEANLHFDQSSESDWATLRHLKKVSKPQVEESDAGRTSLQMKMSSASPYLPRPVWDEKKHSKQRLNIGIFSEAELEGRASASGAGFAIKITSGSCSSSKRQAELEISLKVHGKETSLILPLELNVETKIPSLHQVIPRGVMQMSGKEKAQLKSEHKHEGERCKRVADLCSDCDEYSNSAGDGLHKRKKSDLQISSPKDFPSAALYPLSAWPVLGLPNTDNSLQTLLLLSQLCQKSSAQDASVKPLPLNASNLVNLSSAAVLSM